MSGGRARRLRPATDDNGQSVKSAYIRVFETAAVTMTENAAEQGGDRLNEARRLWEADVILKG